MKNKKKLYWIIGAVVVLLLITLSILKRNGSIGPSQDVKVATDMVSKQTIIEIVSANGKIQPETEVKLSPDVSGEIIELND
jgi:HlyD family secretion protein